MDGYSKGKISMKKVLVVDNHPVMLKLMTRLLEKEGHRVLTAIDGLSALDVLETYIPDVIFIDLIMPNISGEKLCPIIRRMPRVKDAHLVILSGIAAEGELDFIELGADACIAKGPFKTMSKHVLASLSKSGLNSTAGLPGEILGLETINSKNIARELLSIKRHLETILESMSEGILELVPEGRIVYANPIAISLIGKSEERLLSSNFARLFSEPDQQRIQGMLDAIGNGPQTTPNNAPVILNGKQLSLTVVPVQYAGTKRIIILNDVTEQKRMEAQLLHAQKMKAIGTLAGGIAHDFNNLLAGIQGNVSLLLLKLDNADTYSERLRRIEKQVQSGSELTAQLLGYARKGRYDFKPIDLNQLLKETSDTFGRTKKEITIHRQLAEDLWPIEADQGQIEQVLLNLYINAWQAMTDGGDLFLRTMNTTNEKMKGKLYDPIPGNYILLNVIDTGEGMDKKTQDRIFDPFFTTKEMGRGTGLGLASVYGIIKSHNGYIDSDSEKGRGTVFTIYFPASEKEVIKEEKKQSEEIIEASETVLLVDDEGEIVDVSAELLNFMGYNVLSARNGKEAIEVYEKNKDDINIVILDMIMPGMSGGEVYDRMKMIDPHVKVLLSSGYSKDGQAAEILKRGCNGFLQKPFGIKHLSQGIREVLEAV